MDEFEALLSAGHGHLPRLIPAPPWWQRRAACLGEPLDVFYPERHEAKTAVAFARDVCGTCPVMQQCLDWALEHDEHGVWAGMTREQRQQLRRAA